MTLDEREKNNQTNQISHNPQRINGLRLVCSADLDFEIRGLFMKASDPLVAHALSVPVEIPLDVWGGSAGWPVQQNLTDRSTGIRGDIDLRAAGPEVQY